MSVLHDFMFALFFLVCTILHDQGLNVDFTWRGLYHCHAMVLFALENSNLQMTNVILGETTHAKRPIYFTAPREGLTFDLPVGSEIFQLQPQIQNSIAWYSYPYRWSGIFCFVFVLSLFSVCFLYLEMSPLACFDSVFQMGSIKTETYGNIYQKVSHGKSWNVWTRQHLEWSFQKAKPRSWPVSLAPILEILCISTENGLISNDFGANSKINRNILGLRNPKKSFELKVACRYDAEICTVSVKTNLSWDLIGYVLGLLPLGSQEYEWSFKSGDVH